MIIIDGFVKSMDFIKAILTFWILFLCVLCDLCGKYSL